MTTVTIYINDLLDNLAELGLCLFLKSSAIFHRAIAVDKIGQISF